MTGTRRPSPAVVASGAAAAIALLPFLRGLALGNSFYFRDLAGQFFPFRRFISEGLRHGESRYWNPLSYEGVPLSAPPLAYPVELLHLLAPNEWGASMLLALHVPLAAILFTWLARGLGLSPLASAGGAVVYALGGFAVSTLNLYVYVQALAWAPLIVLTLMRAPESRRRAVYAALALAIGTSTMGAEIVLQAAALGGLLAWRRREARTPAGIGRVALAGLLAAGLVAPLLVFARGLLASSERSAGFAPEVVLGQSIHPVTLAQVVVANFHGDVNDIVNLWWGMNFFPQGFPYFLSLYLGWTVLMLAAAGLARRDFPRGMLVAVGAFAAWMALGRWAGWLAIAPHLPAVFRFPSKAYFSVHLVVALLAAAGLDVVQEGRRRTTAALAAALLAGGLLLGSATLVPRAAPHFTRWFASGFFPSHWDWNRRFDRLGRLLADAQAGGVFALAAGAVAALAAAGRLAPERARALLVTLVAGDLLRTGAGLNPMVSASFHEVSPEMTAIAARLRDDGARVFTCHVDGSRAYHEARAARASHELWTFAVDSETLLPFWNMNVGVASAYGIDRTMLVPAYRVLLPEDAACGGTPLDTGALRAAGVSHVISLDPLADADVRLLEVIRPPRITPLAIHLYALQGVLPRCAVAAEVQIARTRAEAESLADVDWQGRGGAVVEGLTSAVSGAQGRVVEARTRAGHIEMTVTTDRDTVAVVREGHHEGWTARVNGAPAPVWRANGRHLAVPVRSGTSRVLLDYEPPGARRGLLVALLSAAAAAGLWRRP